jgi:hypothetical protein
MTTLAPATYYGDGLYGDGYYVEGSYQNYETTIANIALTPLPPPVFTGMKLQADVSLGDLVLNKIDANNVIWVCTEIEGWWDLPDPDIPDVTRGWRDGSYDARGRWQARQITLNGVILPPNPDFLPAARNTLINAANLVYSGAWLKTRESPTRASYVRLSGRPDISTVNARGRTEFSIGLRAADPIKYSWNDSDPDGYNLTTIACKNTSTSATGEAVINNVGNTSVSVFLEVTGPTVGDATIYNVATDELLTIIEPLRGAETRTVTNKVLTGNVATLTFSTTHTIVVGDLVTVSGVDSTFNGEVTVVAIPTTSTISYDVTAGNVASTGSSGTVARAADFLEIDTYEREVSLNGIITGARVKIDTLTDWTTLAAGNNTIRFIDEGDATADASLKVYYRSGWIG